MGKIIEKILCKIGVHKWHWTLQRGEMIYLNSIPPRAKCVRCGITYRKELKDE